MLEEGVLDGTLKDGEDLRGSCRLSTHHGRGSASGEAGKEHGAKSQRLSWPGEGVRAGGVGQ